MLLLLQVDFCLSFMIQCMHYLTVGVCVCVCMCVWMSEQLWAVNLYNVCLCTCVCVRGIIQKRYHSGANCECERDDVFGYAGVT